MFGISFAECLVIGVVAIFLADMRSITKAIKLCRNFLEKLFKIRNEILAKISDMRDLWEEVAAPEEEYVIDSNKALHKTVGQRIRVSKKRKASHLKSKLTSEL